ncbi:MAG TPA: hypothetical protein VM101_00505 [Flavitalea sp.]|nr:hypothetical protein [Flavitalea sp.]
MKQTFYAIGMLMIFVFNQATAQTSKTSFITRSSIMKSPYLKDVTAAAENFKKEFKDARNIEWVNIPNGYRAYFQDNDILTAVDYNKKGKLNSVIRYGKSLMTSDMRTLIENTFDAPVIREISEVKIAGYGDKVYIVILEDKKSMKTVQILNDEIKVISEVAK